MGSHIEIEIALEWSFLLLILFILYLLSRFVKQLIIFSFFFYS